MGQVNSGENNYESPPNLDIELPRPPTAVRWGSYTHFWTPCHHDVFLEQIEMTVWITVCHKLIALYNGDYLLI